MRLVPQRLWGTDRIGVAGAVPRFRYEPGVGTARGRDMRPALLRAVAERWRSFEHVYS
jgi:hypothetical protein